MRNPAIRTLLVAFLVVALVAGAGIVVSGDAPSTLEADQYVTSSSTLEPQPVHATGSTAVGPVPQADPPSQIETFDPDSETRVRIDLQPNRDARWEIAVRYEFDDENRTEPFESVGDRFLNGDIGPDPVLFERFAADASANVDREMGITDVDREVVVIEDPDEMDLESARGDDADATDGEPPVAVGELRLTFVWTGFLAQDGENLELGDAFTTPDDGTWLQSLEGSQTITVMTPEGYSVIDTDVPLQDNAVIIEGPRVFEGDDRVVVVYSPTSSTPPWTLITGAIVLAALLIAGGLVGYRRFETGTDDGESADRTDEAAGGAVASSRESNGVGLDADGGDDADGGTEPDLSLLSDEERVERLLDRNGGRMRQADIVSETGWSDAKVSQLLSTMSDEGRVEKLRLGRENLISFPDHEEADDSPEGGSGSSPGRDGPHGGDDGSGDGDDPRG